ncbi:hypothetical protein EVAR_4454_1 [Eumeta japonica]|uniref:Uncharacterized protein n=1 Tax=Eumeta variegata TaxID=151549 RepID=A0A4C1SXN6_EUMVA|nr:hypothetical protein EVAR_4454_1 [Eumeta japonica]
MVSARYMFIGTLYILRTRSRVIILSSCGGKGENIRRPSAARREGKHPRQYKLERFRSKWSVRVQRPTEKPEEEGKQPTAESEACLVQPQRRFIQNHFQPSEQVEEYPSPTDTLHRVRPDGTCECRRRVTCAMDDAWRESSRHRMSQETVTGRFPSRPPSCPAGGG